jgi:hypothetical protein
MYCSQLVYQHTVTFPLWQSYEPSLFKHSKLVNLYCFGTDSLHRYVLWYSLVLFQFVGLLTRSCMESLICLGYSMGRKNEVFSAKRPYTGKCMTLHTVLKDYNRQMFIIIFPLQPMFTESIKCRAVQYLFIYLSSLVLNTTLIETLNSTVLVFYSSQSTSHFSLTQQECLKT